MSALLEVRDLVKTYGTGEAATRVLRGLSLSLEAGEIAALLGPFGSDKSTLLKPTSGSSEILGQEMLAADDRALTGFRNRHIGLVFQFHDLLPDFTALENVVFPTAVREGRETAPARARGRDLLVRMGLGARIDFPTANLSGGQKQRVAVARALMNGPELVPADEPTGNLDRASATQAKKLIAEINHDAGTTFLISTHDDAIAGLCRRRIVVGEGVVTGCANSGGISPADSPRASAPARRPR